MSFFTQPNTINSYGNGKKLKLFFKYTDANFWEITQFEFLEGRPYTQREIDQNEPVAVINNETSSDYFGKGVPAAGKYIEINGQSLRCI
ncbi:MAG: ABC transporter permease [Lewinellaceae bacterium]|nr:ABC transporter permease [Lewinellaceae bacterium]